MESINNRIKVALICYVSNPMIRSHLVLDNRILYNRIRKLLGLPTKSTAYGDIAPWTSLTINELSKKNLELCVITPHSGLKRPLVSFEDNGVNYNIIACDYGNMLGKIIKNDDLWMMMNPVGRRITKVVDAFRPQIVVLIGAENSFYAYPVLSIEKYPVLVLCQTIYNNPERHQYSIIDKQSANIEKRIFLKKQYFAVYSKMHYDLLKSINPKAQIFKFGFPSKGIVLEPTPIEKEYDFVNFAYSLDLRKGIHDSIRAIAVIRNKYPKVTLNLVGGLNSDQKVELDKLIDELDVEENIIFTPFFEKQSDLFLHIQKSRYAVLPCKLDNISGTMSQAMSLNIPLVVYSTPGTQAINRDAPCILIAEKNNIQDLVEKMLYFFEHPDEARKMAINARALMIRSAEYKRGNAERLLGNFKNVIESFSAGTPVPNKYLFNPEIDD